jgi:hypothetical protein
VLGVVRQVVQRLAPGLRREDRTLAARDRLGGLQCRRDAFRRGDQQAVVVAEHEVARGHLDAAAGDGRPQRGPRRGRPRSRRRAAREHGQPDATQALQVAAEPVGDDPGEPAPAGLRGEQLAEHGARTAVRRDHEDVARGGLGKRAHDRQMVVLGDDGECRPGHAHLGEHRPNRGVDHRQRLVGVRERRDVDAQQPLDQVHG